MHTGGTAARLARHLRFLLISALLAACSQQQEDDGKTVIRYASGGNTGEVMVIRQSIEAFEAANPDITVKHVHIPGSYEQVLMTMMAGGDGPDLFLMTPTTVESYVSKGILMDITERVAQSDIINRDDFFEATLAPYQYDGRQFSDGPLYGLCKDWSPDRLVVYNKTLFDETGIPYPDGSWDREEFVEIAKRLTIRDEKGRTTQFGVYNNSEIDQWVVQSGGSLYSEDYRRCTLNEPAAIRGLQFAADLTVKHHVSPRSGEGAQLGTENVMFETGRVAMCFYGMWITPILNENIQDFEWGVTTPPRDVRDVYLAMGMVGFGINARSEHPDAAWKLMEHEAGTYGQKMRAEKGWNIPATKSVAYGPAFQNNPDLDPEIVNTFLDALDKTEFMQVNPYIIRPEFDLYFRPEWELVLLGEKNVQDAMDEVVERVNQAIEDNMRIMGVD